MAADRKVFGNLNFGVVTRSRMELLSDSKHGAGDGIRTRDINLGKVALYQLSYSRLESHK